MDKIISRMFDEDKDYFKLKAERQTIETNVEQDVLLQGKRDICVLFSGGLDSAVLVHAMGHFLKEKESNKSINLFITKSALHGGQFQDYSQQAIDKLLCRYREEGLNITVSYVETMVTKNHRSTSQLHYTRQHGYPYQMTLFNTIMTQIKSNCDVFMGIVAGDGLPASLEKFQDYFYTGMELLGRKNDVLHFPLIDIHKFELIEYAKQHHFYDKTVSCEVPTDDYKPCGMCCSCVSRIASEAAWQVVYGEKEEDRKVYGKEEYVEKDMNVEPDTKPTISAEEVEEIVEKAPEEIISTEEEVEIEEEKPRTDVIPIFMTINPTTGYGDSKTTITVIDSGNLQNYEVKSGASIDDTINIIINIAEAFDVKKIFVTNKGFGLEIINKIRNKVTATIIKLDEKKFHLNEKEKEK
jgi:7-cyano-7-deazaguanine synthase in queuosine biosynthesis